MSSYQPLQAQAKKATGVAQGESSGSYSSSTQTAKKRSAEDDHDGVGQLPSKKRMKRRECSVCCIDIAVNRFPKVPHKGAESHERGVCFECWERHLDAEVEAQAWNGITCPECNEKLEGPEIKKLASTNTYSR
jgi:hypothetical protein